MSQHSVKFDEDKRHAVYNRDGYKCQYCGHHDATGHGVGLSLDHIDSRASGGAAQNTKGSPATNLVTACHACNFAKQDKSPRAWGAYIKAKVPPEGGVAVDWSKIRRQATKKIDIKEGEKRAAVAREARALRKAGGAPRPEPPAASPAPATPTEEHPKHEGPGIHHGDDGRFLPGGEAHAAFALGLEHRRHIRGPAPKLGKLSLARAVEADAEGKAPTAVRLWRAGLNKTDKGNVRFSPRSARLVMQAYKRRGNPLVFDFEHESMLSADKRGGAAMRGVGATKHADLEVRNDEMGQPELWATNIQWTDEAARQIETGERRQISPWCSFDTETREVTEIINCALCREGATHFGTILASAGKGQTMDELQQQLQDAIDGSDWETAESLIQQMEAADGGMGMAKMARYAMDKAKGEGGTVEPAAPPAPAAEPPPADETATKKLAAARRDASTTSDAFTRGMAELDAATKAANAAAKRSDVATVRTMIAASRDCFDVVDEKQHLAAADPIATERHIASIRRKMNGEGTLAASRGGATQARDVKPPKDAAGAGDSHGLDATEIAAATQLKVPLADFAAAKKRNAESARGRRAS
jgi:phage I-like protein